jgi:hypothetical protein
MSNCKFLVPLALLALVFCLPAIAAADSTWSTGRIWTEGPSYATGQPELFDKIEIFMVDNTSLTAPVMIDIPQSGWTSVLVNPTYNLITGPETNYLGLFNMQLPAPSTQARTFDYLVFDKGSLLYGQTITLGGGHLEYPLLVLADGLRGSNGQPYNRTMASLPGTLLLFLTGVLGLLLLSKRQKIHPAPLP